MENKLHLGLEGFKKLLDAKILANKQLNAPQIDIEKEFGASYYSAKTSFNLNHSVGTIKTIGTTTTNINPSQHIGYWQVKPSSVQGVLSQITGKKESYEIKQLLAETRNEIDELELKLLKLKDLCNILEAKDER